MIVKDQFCHCSVQPYMHKIKKKYENFDSIGNRSCKRIWKHPCCTNCVCFQMPKKGFRRKPKQSGRDRKPNPHARLRSEVGFKPGTTGIAFFYSQSSSYIMSLAVCFRIASLYIFLSKQPSLFFVNVFLLPVCLVSLFVVGLSRLSSTSLGWIWRPHTLFILVNRD